MGNVWAADSMLGIHVDKSLQTHSKDACVEHAQVTSGRIMQLFPDVKQVYNTFRFETNELKYFATLNTPGHSFVSKTYSSPDIVDKVGSGDCFMAGIIHGTLNNRPPQEILDFCTSAAFQKLFTKGETNTRSAEEIVLFSNSYAS